MAFESLGDKLQNVFKKLKGKGKLTEKEVNEAMREVKLALLEADVNFKVVKEFVKNVSEKAVGEEVLTSLTPGQQIVKIVNDELTAIMGGENEKIVFENNGITVIMLVGLQGAGKTTACAKLASFMKKKQAKRPMLVACDVYRPAAIKQLHVVGEQVGVPVFSLEDEKNVVKIATDAMDHAKQHGNDVVIIDTAGRLHINEELMDELLHLQEALHPSEILLTIDAMTGQDAVNVAESFSEKLNITGVILSKLDSDTRGGAALSVRHITGKPIKFASVGEKLTDLEPFYPDRMASRILGMGDVLSLIDKAQEAFDEQEAKKLEEKIKKNKFDLDDLLAQMEQMKKLGPLEKIVKMIPGVDTKALEGADLDDRKLDRIGAIIKSMTQDEKENPKIINASRKQRIANGSGSKVQDVNLLLKQFEQMNEMMKKFSGGKMGKKLHKKGKKKKKGKK